MGIVDKFKKWIKDDEKIVVPKSTKEIPREELFDMLNLTPYEAPVKVNDFTPGRPSLLIVDDIMDTAYIYNEDLSLIEVKEKIDVNSKINVLHALGKNSGFTAYKYIVNGGKVDYAVLDITMVSKIKFPSGELLDIDGVDIAIELSKHCPDAKFVFCTAHAMKKGNSLMKYYVDKIEANFCQDNGLTAEDLTIHKSSSYAGIYNLIKDALK